MTAEPSHDRRPQFTFGDHLRKARKLLGMTQQEFADALGVTVKNVDSWESDRNRPRDLVDIATRVEDLADLDRGWMLGFYDAGRGGRRPPGRGPGDGGTRGGSDTGQYLTLAAAA